VAAASTHWSPRFAPWCQGERVERGSCSRRPRRSRHRPPAGTPRCGPQAPPPPRSRRPCDQNLRHRQGALRHMNEVTIASAMPPPCHGRPSAAWAAWKATMQRLVNRPPRCRPNYLDPREGRQHQRRRDHHHQGCPIRRTCCRSTRTIEGGREGREYGRGFRGAREIRPAGPTRPPVATLAIETRCGKCRTPFSGQG